MPVSLTRVLDSCCRLFQYLLLTHTYSQCYSAYCEARSSMAVTPPTLSTILLDAAPPPWTLNAFTGYLSEKHCMELLEFLRDSQRYSELYEQLKVEQPPSAESLEQIQGWWKYLMQVYITPSAPRQINIPSAVQDSLLRTSCDSIPPDSSELDDVCRMVCELLNESVLIPFLQSIGDAQVEGDGHVADQRPPTTTAVMSADHSSGGCLGSEVDSSTRRLVLGYPLRISHGNLQMLVDACNRDVEKRGK
ncbi:PAK-box protein [Purpureocillium lilacinum]|uniref:PAK-box protein n=1 Tax=Purpureocillium lilacinum TaxID=33203 RepID=A0A179FK46_PURLI|nr:PAK-box protein [Purpureocillium lilacinum]